MAKTLLFDNTLGLGYSFVGDTGARYLVLRADFVVAGGASGLTRTVQLQEYFSNGVLLYPTTLPRLTNGEEYIVELSALQASQGVFGGVFRSIAVRARDVFNYRLRVWSVQSFPP